MPAIAQTGTPTTSEAPRRFNIPAQALRDALRQLMHQGDIQIGFEADNTEGKTSAAVSGSMATGEALSRLLAGTGLTFRYLTSGSVMLEKAPQSAEGAIQLGPVRVESGGDGSGAAYAPPLSDPGATEGSRSYAGSVASSATGLNLTPRETPQSITIITRQQIEEQNLTSLQAVMTQVPGIAVSILDSERVTFGSRGAELNLMVDGVAALGALSNESAQIARTSMAIYDRIEVLRGSAGLMNGTGGFGGSVNLVRKRPIPGAFTPKLTVGGGSWDYLQGMADISFDVTADGGVRARAVAYAQDGGSNLDYYDKFAGVFYGIAEFDLGDDAVLGLGVEHSFFDVQGNSFGAIPAFWDDGALFLTPRSYNPSARQSRDDGHNTTLFGDLTWKVANGWQIKLQGNYGEGSADLRRSALAPYYGQVSREDGTIPASYQYFPSTDRSHMLSGKIEGSFEAFGRRQDVVASMNWSKRRTWRNLIYFLDLPTVSAVDWNSDLPIPSAASADEDIFEYRGIERQERFLAYLSMRLRPIEPVSIILGVNYAKYKLSNTYYYDSDGGEMETDANNYKGRFLPYAGLSVDIGQKVTAYASYSDIFRPQDVRDISANVLPPISGSTYEIGLKGEFLDGRLQPALALFVRKENNYPEETNDVVPPELGGLPDEIAYRAISGVTTKGVEATVAGEPLPGWTLQAGYAYWHISQSDEAAFEIGRSDPRQTFTLATSAAVTDRLKLGGSLYWQEKTSASVASFEIVQKSYVLAGLFAQYRMSDKWRISANVDNLFDKKYFEQIGYYDSYTWGKPRSVVVTLSYGLN
ncbi:TonB-dependent siderophore receptor [Sphingobium limneticum]|nr:outer-membrane receptor for ferric coprogen and ferric-rhodotorulic acid [Sphingobium sp. YG1]